MPALHFMLVPDAGAARRVRRRIAEKGARSGVVVVTRPGSSSPNRPYCRDGVACGDGGPNLVVPAGYRPLSGLAARLR
jgi:hypothetical protein